MRGAWIEITRRSYKGFGSDGRSPCGERGLKWVDCVSGIGGITSLPVRGAWIEMPLSFTREPGLRASLPVRGAWIEIQLYCEILDHTRVAPRAGSVD